MNTYFIYLLEKNVIEIVDRTTITNKKVKGLPMFIGHRFEFYKRVFSGNAYKDFYDYKRPITCDIFYTTTKKPCDIVIKADTVQKALAIVKAQRLKFDSCKAFQKACFLGEIAF